jgi:hypothetical protein
MTSREWRLTHLPPVMRPSVCILMRPSVEPTLSVVTRMMRSMDESYVAWNGNWVMTGASGCNFLS